MVCKVLFNDDETKSQHGDHMYIDTALAIRIMVHGLGLTKIAQLVPVELCFTSDGAQLTAHTVSHTSAGIKVTDLSAINPETGEKLFVKKKEDGSIEYQNAQVREFAYVTA